MIVRNWQTTLVILFVLGVLLLWSSASQVRIHQQHTSTSTSATINRATNADAPHVDDHDESPQPQPQQQQQQQQQQHAAGEVDTCMTNLAAASSASKPAVVTVGSHPIGTYICDYFVGWKNAVHKRGGSKSCTLTCPLRLPLHSESEDRSFQCQIREKASSAEAKSATAWDVMMFHYGAPPVAPDPRRQMVVFYSGESNRTEAKRARPEYQRKFHHVVSCHHTRRFFFTWTARFRGDFLAIAARDAALSAAALRSQWHTKRINAAVIFFSRCGRGGRDKIIEALRTNGIPVHSFGKCQRTHFVAKEHPECAALAPPGEKKGTARYAEKLCVYRKYRYVLALDNTNEEDYVTEKIYHAFVAGAVPLYDGAPNIEDFVPTPSSFIPLRRYLVKESSSSSSSSSSQLAASSALRTDPKSALDFAKLRADLVKLDRGSAIADNDQEESAATYFADSLLEWRRRRDLWSAAFWRNLNHREPTCDICNLALRRKCEPGA